MDRNGEAIGLLRSVCLRESSEQSFSAGVVSTELGCAGTCACWLAVIALAVASPAVLNIVFLLLWCIHHGRLCSALVGQAEC